MKRRDNYRDVRGFNYQPSYGSHGLEIWGERFDPVIIERELSLGRAYFPKMNTVRLWLSHDAFIADADRCTSHVDRMLDIVGNLDLVAIVVLFNGWHTYPDFGGISTEQIGHFSGERFALFTEYVERIVQPHADDPRVLLWDLCNEPFNNARTPQAMETVMGWLERIRQACQAHDPEAPLCVGMVPNMGQIRLVEPISDVITFHPYYAWNAWVQSQQEVVDLLDQVVDLGWRTGKPVLATETGWGSLDDWQRRATLAFELGELAKREIGFTAHLLHHTLVADGHRPGCGPITFAGYMAFIEADGTLRPGHGIFNDF